MRNITQGLVPDSSGDTIINNSPLSDIYLVLLGRSGNQHGHGGTSPGGTLTMSSTTHPTKGMVYLGGAQQTAYDETNERIGVAQPVPTAKVHIKIADPAQITAPATAGAGAGDWSNVGSASFLISLSDSSDATYAEWNGTLGAASVLQGDFTTGLSDPGTDSGFTLKLTAKSSTIATGATMQIVIKSGATIVKNYFDVGFNGNTFSPVDANVTTSFAVYTLAFTALEAANFNFAQTWTWAINFSGVPTADKTFDVSRIEIDVPAAGASDVLQKWESTSVSNTLNYVNDALSNKVLAVSGGPHLAVQASGFDLTIGTPASGSLWEATNAVGAGVWLASGAQGDILRSTGTTPTWTALTGIASASSFPHVILDSTVHTDTLTGTVVRGDLVYGNSTPKWARLAKGSSGQLFGTDGTDVLWRSLSAVASSTSFPHVVLDSSVHTDTLTSAVVRGAVIYGNATPKWALLTHGTSAQVLTTDGTDVLWADVPAGGTATGTTVIQHRWEANGYYRVDGDVDGAYIAPRACTLNRVLLYRRAAGSSGTTRVDLFKNGVTMMSTAPLISASAGSSATAAGVTSVNTIAQFDRLTVSAVSAEVGNPQDWALMMEAV